MLPGEMVILMAIAITRDSGKKLLTRPMDINGQYVDYLYDSLVERGYLKGNSSGGYELTWKGRKSLVEFLRMNKVKINDTIQTLEQLGIEKSREIDRLVEEVVKVR
jgi:predicted transcriptional regulator